MFTLPLAARMLVMPRPPGVRRGVIRVGVGRWQPPIIPNERDSEQQGLRGLIRDRQAIARTGHLLEHLAIRCDLEWFKRPNLGKRIETLVLIHPQDRDHDALLGDERGQKVPAHALAVNDDDPRDAVRRGLIVVQERGDGGGEVGIAARRRGDQRMARRVMEDRQRATAEDFAGPTGDPLGAGRVAPTRH